MKNHQNPYFFTEIGTVHADKPNLKCWFQFSKIFCFKKKHKLSFQKSHIQKSETGQLFYFSNVSNEVSLSI